MTLKMLADNIIIEPQPTTETKTTSGIVIPDVSSANTVRYGTVLYAGPEAGVDVGAVVMFSVYTGAHFNIDNRPRILLKKPDIIAIVEK